MKLSEAIRKGCELYPVPCTGRFYNPETGCVCALGAAYVGLGNVIDDKDYNTVIGVLNEAYPELGCEDDGWTLGCDIADLNDKRGKTREEIADWLEKEHNL